MLLTRSRQLAAHLVHTGRVAARRLAARRVAALSTSSQARTTLAPSLTDAMQDEPASRDRASTVQTTALDRPRVVVLGTGWSSFRFVRELRREHYHVTVVSPRNHFLFTPLLPSTTVGTLEFRAIIEPIRSLKRLSFIQGKALSVDTEAQQVLCRDVYHEDGDEAFKVDYDYLVVGAGLRTGTFGIPGVKEHCFFLKQLDHARAIRNRIVELFERASVPGVSQQEQDRLLTFVVVGGGPTSVEFASELYDFIEQDVVKFFPELAREKARIVLVEASGAILGNFDKDLSEYAKTVMFRRRRIKVMTNTMVKEVTPGAVKYTDASGESGEIHSWLKVWSAGLEPTDLVQQLGLNWEKQDRTGRLHVTPDLRVRSAPTRCFAFGDCAVNPEEPLPCTASVADQQGKYLAKRFNQCAEKGMGPEEGFDEQFKYHNRGMMAYLGGYKGLADVGSAKGKGFLAWLLWRSAYLTMTVSISNKLLIPMFWFKSWAFGRDISRF